MADKVTEIIVQFRRPPHMMFTGLQDEELSPNVLSLCLQPDEGVHLKFGVKIPDQGMAMASKDMEFHYDSAFKDQDIPEAYERLLQDALEGDASLFIRSDHIEEAWRIVAPLLDGQEGQGTPRPQIYEPGSWGPASADGILSQLGDRWLGVCGAEGEGHA